MAKLVSREGNKATVQFVIAQEDFKKAINEAYNKTKGRYNIPGFRKGKAPRRMIENAYGEGVFYEEALNISLQPAYSAAIDELKLDVVSRPDIDVKTFEMDKDIEIEAVVDLMPIVELPDYKGIECSMRFPKFDEGVYDKEVKKQLEMNARMVPVEGRKTEKGDTVVIDFLGKKDGVPFEGGSAENHQLELGSNSFIPGFEDQLIGKDAGEDVEVKVTFPENYGKRDLAGKEAVFDVKIHEIKMKELPELDDDFISEISEFETEAEYKADFLEKARKNYEDRLTFEKKNAAIKQLAEITVIDIPESMVDAELERSIADLDYKFMRDGFSVEQYLKLTGMDMAAMREQMRPSAAVSTKNKLIVNALVESLNPEVSEDDINREIEEAAKYGGMSVEEIRSFYEKNGYDSLKEQLKTQKVLDILVENAKFEINEPGEEDEEMFDQAAFEEALDSRLDDEENEE